MHFAPPGLCSISLGPDLCPCILHGPDLYWGILHNLYWGILYGVNPCPCIFLGRPLLQQGFSWWLTDFGLTLIGRSNFVARRRVPAVGGKS